MQFISMMLPVTSVVFEVVGTGLDIGTSTDAECVDGRSTSADGRITVIELLHRV